MMDFHNCLISLSEIQQRDESKLDVFYLFYFQYPIHKGQPMFLQKYSFLKTLERVTFYSTVLCLTNTLSNNLISILSIVLNGHFSLIFFKCHLHKY